jgi:hypothetical protein
MNLYEQAKKFLDNFTQAKSVEVQTDHSQYNALLEKGAREEGGLKPNELEKVRMLAGRLGYEDKWLAHTAIMDQANELELKVKAGDQFRSEREQKAAAAKAHQDKTDEIWAARVEAQRPLNAAVKALDDKNRNADAARDELDKLKDTNRALFGLEPKRVYQPLPAGTVIRDIFSVKSERENEGKPIIYKEPERPQQLPTVYAPDLHDATRGDAPPDRGRPAEARQW